MEYYDHIVGREEPRGSEPGYREYRDQYGSYRTSIREEGQRDIRQYRDYRGNHYRGRRNNYYHYNRGGGRGYYRGDRDFRDDRDMRSDQGRVPVRNSHERSSDGEMRSHQPSRGFESDDHSSSENREESKIIGTDVNPKRATKQNKKRGSRNVEIVTET